jgi:hypothetical protein
MSSSGGKPAPEPKDHPVDLPAASLSFSESLTATRTRWEIHHPWQGVAAVVVFAAVIPFLNPWLGHRLPGWEQALMEAALGLVGVAAGIRLAKPERKTSPVKICETAPASAAAPTGRRSR